MDPMCGTEEKGNKYWEKIWKEYHQQKEYVEPHPIVTTRNVASLQHRWGIIQGEVNKYAGYYSQVTKPECRRSRKSMTHFAWSMTHSARSRRLTTDLKPSVMLGH